MPYQESETVELKSVVVDDIKKEIIAFANSAGGTLYIGVQDDGEVIGLEDPDGAALQVSNMVRDSIKPDVHITLQKGNATGGCLCPAGVFLCSGHRHRNSSHDQGDGRRPL